jgi:DNA-binding transcriptional LysR family regulator
MSPEVVRLVVGGKVDFGLATLPVDEPGAEAEPLLMRRDVLIVPPGHPLLEGPPPSALEVADYPLLLLEKGSTSRLLLDRTLASEGVSPGRMMSLGSIEVIKRFCEIGLGIAVVPQVSVELDVSQGRLVEIQLPWLPQRQVGVVRRRASHMSPAAETFLDYLRKRFQGSPSSSTSEDGEL